MERTEDQKRRESVALFRHALIGDLVHEHQGLYAKLREKAERDYEIPFRSGDGWRWRRFGTGCACTERADLRHFYRGREVTTACAARCPGN